MEELLAKLEAAQSEEAGAPALWTQAVTHASYANERGLPKGAENERLEFLGDAVVGLAVSRYLYENFPERPEGELAKMRAEVVRADALAWAARKIGLGRFLRLGRGEEKSGGRERATLLGDAFEAVVAALFLERGWEEAEKFVIAILREKLEGLQGPVVDPKTQLQEALQARSKEAPTYRLVGESGPDHQKWFQSEVLHQGKVLGRGEGPSKKAAEQAAAEDALRRMVVGAPTLGPGADKADDDAK